MREEHFKAKEDEIRRRDSSPRDSLSKGNKNDWFEKAEFLSVNEYPLGGHDIVLLTKLILGWEKASNLRSSVVQQKDSAISHYQECSSLFSLSILLLSDRITTNDLTALQIQIVNGV